MNLLSNRGSDSYRFWLIEVRLGRKTFIVDGTSFPYTVELQRFKTDGSFTTAVSNSFLSPQEKNYIAAD